MVKVISEAKEHRIEFEEGGQKGILNETPFEWDVLSIKEGSYHVLKGGYSYNVELLKVDQADKVFTVRVNGNEYEFKLKDRYDELLERLGMEDMQSNKEKEIKAPMPGKVLDVMVEAGQAVSKGEPVIVLEAMKMENVLKAPMDGTIKTVNTSTSSAVEKDHILIELE